MRGTNLLLHVAVWSCAATLAPAQQLAQHKAPRHDVGSWVPTEEGTNWTYHRVTKDLEVGGAEGAARISKGLFGTYQRADGSRWHLVATHDGGAGPRYEHWNTEGPGLLVQKTPAALEPADAATHCPLTGPVGAVNRWEWEVEEKKETVAHRATLVAFEEAVTVPAGSFRAVHVRVEAYGDERKPVSTEDSWYARDVGLVRLERTAGTTREVTELLTFARGRDQTPERLATLQMLAPPAWIWTKRGTAAIRWLDQDPGSVAFGGRFALVGDGAELQLAFVTPGAFVKLAPEGIQAWQEIARGVQRRDFDLIAATAARLHAARLRLANTKIEIEGHGRATLSAASPEGERSFEVLVTVGKRDPAVEVEVRQPGAAPAPAPAEMRWR